MPVRLVPPRRGLLWWIRFGPCSRRLTGRPRPIPGRWFHSLWDKILRRDVLWRAWIAVVRNSGAPGIDTVTLADVEEYGADRLLAELAEDLRSGRYRPLPARRVFIPKPGRPGERGPLSTPAVRDRVVQAP